MKIYTVRGELGNNRTGWLRRLKTFRASSVTDAKDRAKRQWLKPFFKGDMVRFLWVKEGMVGMNEVDELDKKVKWRNTGI